MKNLFVALELSRASWVVAIQSRSQRRPALHKLEAGDVDQLFAAVAKARAAHERRSQMPATIVLL